jgi:L-asparagine oxygenase
MTTIEVAQAIGTVINLEKLLPSAGIPTVQSLRPKKMREVGQNQYSGNYGLGSFPLHTDLAHWALSPHYFLLRCVVGSNDVFTYVLTWAPILDLVGPIVLQKAVFSARRRRIGYSGLVRAMTHLNGADIFRWDPIFLKPLNQDARILASTMHDSTRDCGVVRILLNKPGDTLIVDNWRALHGRSEVTSQGISRRVDRVYLSEVLQ